jgi:hypothetical protein
MIHRWKRLNESINFCKHTNYRFIAHFDKNSTWKKK